jgi:hypothetical protein
LLSVTSGMGTSLNRTRRALLLVALPLFAGGCGKPSPRGAGDNGEANTSRSPVSSGLRDYTVTARDYAFSDLPLHAPEGWLTLRLVNAGTEMHMLGVLRVPRGVSAASVLDSVIQMHIPASVKGWAGVNDVSPHNTGTISAYFPPGEYVAGCFIRSADGVLHVMKGMAGTFDVVASADTGSAGTSDAVVSISNNSLRLSPASLKSGLRSVRVASERAGGADVAVLRLLPGRSPQDGLKWLASPATIAPAAIAVGGASGSEPGQRMAMLLNFAPGRYVFVLQPYDAKRGAVPAYITAMVQPAR